MSTEADLPSLDALILVEPSATPLTTPTLLTEAILSLSDVQSNARPLNTLLDASRADAVNVVVESTRMSGGVGGVMTTLATGTGVTTTVAVSVLPSAVATTRVDPTARPVTRPVVVTEAIEESTDVQATGRPLRVSLFAASIDACSCLVDPTTRLTDRSLITIDATGIVLTVMSAHALLSPAVAVIRADPAARAVAVAVNPLPTTETMLDAFDSHLTVGLSRGPVFPSTVTSRRIVPPTVRVCDVGVI
jgi:hypothetical protein